MYFERTEIQNFKGIEKMNLEFSSGVNLLIGNNGVGKTTVLEGIGSFNTDLFQSNERHCKEKALKRTTFILPAILWVTLRSTGCILIRRS